MKIARLPLIMFFALVAGACATTSSQDLAGTETAQPGLTEKYVHTVNKEAKSRGVKVHWVAYPSDEQVSNRLKVDDD